MLWWHDIVRAPETGPNNEFLDMVGLDATIIMNPKVWIASGHVGGFSDPMIDDRETKQRFRFDHVMVYVHPTDPNAPAYAFLPDSPSEAKRKKQATKTFGAEPKVIQYSTIKDTALLARIIAPEAEKPGTFTEAKQFNLMFEKLCRRRAGRLQQGLPPS